MNANEKAIFTMYGGTVTGGTAKEGANISGRATATAKSQLHLLGGTVTGSTGTDKSADVYAAGLITVGGDVRLGGVYLASGVSVEVSDDFAGKHAVVVNTADVTVPVASGLTSEQAAAFTSGNHGYETGYDAQKKALFLTAKKHIHCTCVGGEHIADHTACTQVQWQEVPAVADNKITITESGRYYLTENVAVTLTIADGLSVELCLNGYKLYGRTPVTVAAGIKLDICDHTGEGMIYSSREDSTGYTLKVSGGEVNLYSGILSGKHADKEVYNRPVQLADGTFTMYGGTIRNGKAKNGENGGNVLITGGSFCMYGGTISGGQVTGSNKHGGNICIQNGSFLLEDGTITAGQATGKGGNVMIWSDAANKHASFTMTGGIISGGLTEEGAVNAANGGNVCVNSANSTNRSSAFIITGGTVTGGKVSGEGGGVFAYKSEGSSITVGGTASITGNTAGGVENNVYLDQGKTVAFHAETALDADNTDGTIARIGIHMHTAGVFAETSDEAQALLDQLCFQSDDLGNPNITADGSSLKLGT